MSNHLLDTVAKERRTKNAFRQWCAAGAVELGALFALLHDTERAPDAMLPATGVTLGGSGCCRRLASSSARIRRALLDRRHRRRTRRRAFHRTKFRSRRERATGEIDVRFAIEEPV